MAAAHRHTAAAVQVVGSEVSERRRAHADVDGVGARGGQSFDERIRQLRAGEASVAAHRESRSAALARNSAERAADVAHELRGQRLADDSADVVGPEDFRRDGHCSRKSSRRFASQP